MTTYEDLSDPELLGRSGDDPEAFGVFYDRHVTALLGFFYARTGSAESAAELTSETFAQAFLSRKRYRPGPAPARAWLLGIARHQFSRMIRRQRIEDRARRRLGMEPVAVDDASLQRIEDLVDFAPLRAEIRAAVGTLSPSLARAIQLRVAEGLSYPEIAVALGCTEGAARVRVARGLSKVAELLEVRDA